MNENVAKKMKYAAKTFRRNASGGDDWLSDNYYILERHAVQAAKDCKTVQRQFKSSDFLYGLFMRCRDMCEKGVLPDEKKIAEFFGKGGIDGTVVGYLPLAITCALIDIAAEGVRSGGKALANSVSSLRRMAETDFDFIAEIISVSEEFLLSDPSGIYPSMDSESKRRYRRLIALHARKNKISEREFAADVLEKAQKSREHIGKYIVKQTESCRGMVFLLFEIIMPLAAAVSLSVLFGSPVAGLLSFFPLWELMRHPIERVSVKGVRPIRFLRLSSDDERVMNAHTLITVSTLLPTADKIAELEKHLEQVYLSNCIGNIRVCCLADFKSAESPQKPEDKSALKAAKEAFERLNKKYSGGFILAVRPRVFSKTQGEFIGRERKRGAITELVNAIKGNTKGFCELFGDTENLSKVKYLIALDYDTQLVFDSARELVAIAEHPLNKPISKNGRVVEGYGVLVPKTENRLSDGKTSLFSRIMAGDTGITAYDSLSNERYQDLFGEGIFSGKGLINVEVFHSVLNGKLPAETVLSHDIVEGGYLRAGYVSDVQITDSFPQSSASFYRRLHRWVRGDWQNIGFIFGKNPLNFISRYKMFDNIRRSTAPAFCIAALISSMFIKNDIAVIMALISLIALASGNLVSAIESFFSGGLSSISRLYFSKKIPFSLGCLLRAYLSAAFIAKESFVCLSAALTALWRLFISRKKLLEWTTAAQSEKSDTKFGIIISFLPSLICGALLFIYGLPIHRLAGLIILTEIPITLMKQSSRGKKAKISSGQREKLLSYASAMWGFFDDLCDKSNNCLPPDNISISPERKVACRTSPTNIGLMLVSFLAARDFGFITSAELYNRLAQSLETVEKLEKYEGNLLNWYDTVTLKTLEPRFVSAVDSGNFLCCLTALKEGLHEYKSEYPKLSEIIEKAEIMINATNLRPMYNERRNLFHIGISPDSGEKSGSYYDLYMSEMRMTAYFAVARRIVPKKHWGAMGRIFAARGRYTGLVSWTGTMFEYFMPNLFVPSPSGSLSEESLRFCLYCQKKNAASRPFGVSESGFYAFDGNLNYQYKAHGIQKLGLRRGLDKEYVVSPYSSFLTLSEAPALSLKNLRRLEKIGMTGKYGFFEAADFTEKRNNGNFSVVRSFMAHHIGMSFVALDNLINSNIMQKRFMKDSFMRGASSLLEEKMPTDAAIFKDIREEEPRHIREKVRSNGSAVLKPSLISPNSTLFSNGRMTTCITDCGTGVTLFDSTDVTVNSGDIMLRPQGVFAVFVTENERIPFCCALDPISGIDYGAEFHRSKAILTAEHGSIKLQSEIFLLENHNCEVRRYTVENIGTKSPIKGKIIVYFEPCLEKRKDFASHPAFSKLFLLDDRNSENKCVTFYRNERTENTVCALTAGFVEDTDVKFETNREKVLRTPKGVFSLGEKTDFSGERGNPDCCCAFSVDIELEIKEKKSLDFAIAVEETKEASLNTFLTVRSLRKKSKAVNPFHGDLLESAVAKNILSRILYPKLGIAPIAFESECDFSKKELWSFGVSGDLPIILIVLEDEDQTDCIVTYVRLNKQLRSCGIMTDLVVAYNCEEGYKVPIASSIKKILLEEECSLMEGVKGGVHIVNFSSHSPVQRFALRAYAVYIANDDRNNEKSVNLPFRPLKIKVSPTTEKNEKISRSVKRYNFTKGKIEVYKDPATVDIPWSMIYSNQSFGTMVSDKSLGFTWALNSRENKLTPWYNDVMSDNRGEILFVKYNGVLYDVASLGEAEFTPEKATWTADISGVEIKAQITVPKRGMTKKCFVKIENKSGSIRTFDMMYFTLPVLGVRRDTSSAFFVKKLNNSVTVRCVDSEDKGFCALTCSDNADYFCFSKKNFFEGNFSSSEKEVSSDCCLSIGRKISLAAGGKTSVSFYLSWGTAEKAALMMPFVSYYAEKNLNPLELCSPDKELNLFFNSFLYSQVKQSRFFARTGFYQCSGAYGFRDQLQDSLAFIYFEPQRTLVHIFRCAAVQFIEGDVLHWWHISVDKSQKISGIRTKCSDDMLWLPYSCIVYGKKTGEYDFLNTKIPYIIGEKLSENEKERYFSPERSDFKESLLHHCIRAVDYSLKFGKNGLPLIGSCDWNDGFSNLEGAESVWLAMFLKIVLDGMAEICKKSGLNQKASEYEKISSELSMNIDRNAWAGDRYARAILENGEFLGEKNDFIDILPQAFAVFSDVGTPEKQNTAVDTALKHLYDEDNGVIRLLSPPFYKNEVKNVGYIASYPAGIRENSGQYTHAAVWLSFALLKLGRKTEAEKLLSAINPLSRYKNKNSAEKYRAEPFVLAGDVYYGDGITSRAGWTHFTGSAAWFYRAVIDCYPEYIRKNSQKFIFDQKTDRKAEILNKYYKCENSED